MLNLLVTAVLASVLISSTEGCLHHLKKRQASSGAYPELTTGTDGPADPATIGFTIGHFALLVNDLAATRHFYGDALGLRHIFTYNSSEEYTIMYMGHAQGGKNGTGYQTGEEMFSEVFNMEGLIEFIEFKVSFKSFQISRNVHLFRLFSIPTLTSKLEFIQPPHVHHWTSAIFLPLRHGCPRHPSR
jgi:lactoylglutathione lyase